MTTTTRNEAAERLMHDAVCEFAGGQMCYRLECSTLDAIRKYAAAERKATVERIRAQMEDIGWDLRNDPSELAQSVSAILDEEAAR